MLVTKMAKVGVICHDNTGSFIHDMGNQKRILHFGRHGKAY